MRKREKLSECRPDVQQVIDFANLLPEDYQFNIFDYPDFVAEKHKEWFFALLSGLPENFIYNLPDSMADTREELSKVLNGETLSPHEILKTKKEPFFSEVSKIPPIQFDRVWREYFLQDGKVQHIFPCDILAKHVLQPAVRCRRVLPLFTLYWTFSGVFLHKRGGFPVLPKELLSGCDLIYNPYMRKVQLISYPIDVIVNNEIDISRIRPCPSCDKWFWAKRMDAKTCGEKKCVEKHSSKKYHNENKEEANRKKRQKYYEENNIEFCEHCIRPISTHGESDCREVKGENNYGNL